MFIEIFMKMFTKKIMLSTLFFSSVLISCSENTKEPMMVESFDDQHGCSAVKAQALFKNNFDTYPYTIRSSQQLAYVEKSIKFYKKRIENNPSVVADYISIAQLYIQKGKLIGDVSLFDQAELAAQKSLENRPFKNEGAELTLAKVAEERHQFMFAINKAKMILSDQPSNHSALAILATASFAFGDYDKASSVSNELLTFKDSQQTYVLSALIKSEMGNKTGALNDFQKAIKADKYEDLEGASTVRAFIARLYMSCNADEVAQKYLNESLRILPNNHLALAFSGELSIKKRNFAQAEALLLKAYNSLAEPPYLISLGSLKKYQSKLDEAEKLFIQAEEAIRNEMQSGPYGHHNELVELLLARGKDKDIQEAVIEAEIEVGVRPNLNSYKLLSQALLMNDQPQEALSPLEKALSIQSHSAELLYLASDIYKALGETTLEKKYKEKAQKINQEMIF